MRGHVWLRCKVTEQRECYRETESGGGDIGPSTYCHKLWGCVRMPSTATGGGGEGDTRYHIPYPINRHFIAFKKKE